jgi:hypothetical protein
MEALGTVMEKIKSDQLLSEEITKGSSPKMITEKQSDNQGKIMALYLNKVNSLGYSEYVYHVW